jgi:uncharacterized membrane protein
MAADDADVEVGIETGRWLRGSEEFSRVLGFSDGVFGFALTLLVAGIVVPTLSEGEDLAQALADQVPEIIAFAISVVLIGRFWMAHHAQFARFGAVEPGFVFLNVLYLGMIAFLPFPTAVLGRHEADPAAVVLMAAVLAAVSALEVVITVRATRQRCLRVETTPEQRRVDLLAGLAPAVLFLATIPVALVDGSAAMYAWLLIMPLEWLIGRTFDPAQRVDRRRT